MYKTVRAVVSLDSFIMIHADIKAIKMLYYGSV